MFQGAYTALITPFKEGKINEQQFADFIEWQIAQGIHGLVPAGTTGESPTLDHDEHNRVNEICVEVAKGRVPVIAGTGSNATHEAVAMTQHAQKIGADAALVVVPYYNKPTPEGLYAHYKEIHDNSDIPIILYNVPGRSVVNISDELVIKMAGDMKRIVGIKDATGDMSRPKHVRKQLGEEFTQFSGEDDSVIPFNREGGNGVISVSSNIVPNKVAQVQSLTWDKKWEEAERLQDSLMPLHAAMFCESSPGPVKYAASLLGHCSDEMRLPLVPPREESKAQIKREMEALGLL